MAWSRFIFRWKRSGSVIWRPTRLTGLSDVIGSWKTMAICVPQKWRCSALGSVPTSRPSNLTEPVMLAVRGRMFMIERTSTDLPEPDSPTTPRVSPRSRVNDTSSTARSSPRDGTELGRQVLDVENRSASTDRRWYSQSKPPYVSPSVT